MGPRLVTPDEVGPAETDAALGAPYKVGRTLDEGVDVSLGRKAGERGEQDEVEANLRGA